MTILSSDVGSMPPRVERSVLNTGAGKTNGLLPLLNYNVSEYQIFKDEVVETLIDKLKAGIDVPTYPQFRDMNTMFLELLTGYEREGVELRGTDEIRETGQGIPEVSIIKRESKTIAEKAGLDCFRLKICVTGPYTLSSFFKAGRIKVIEELGKALSGVLQRSLFKTKYGKVEHVSLDEPVLGFLNDHTLDYGQEGREILKESWENIYQVANWFGAGTSIHLHDTSDNLFWETERLDMIGSHVNDPLYRTQHTRKKLMETGKKLVAPIAITQFDSLIAGYYEGRGLRENLPEIVADTWTGIKQGEIDPVIFLEGEDKIGKYLKRCIDFFGEDNISYASPECGLSSFPGYKYSLLCLERISNAVKGLPLTFRDRVDDS